MRKSFRLGFDYSHGGSRALLTKHKCLSTPNSWFMAGITPADEGTACGNGYLTGTNLSTELYPFLAEVNTNSSLLAASFSQSWCTLHDIPNTNNPGQGPYTKQYFARMWYDLLINSDAFLDIKQGTDDPYTWTTGQGCGYVLRGERIKFTGMSEESILSNASRPLYFIDEGELLGVISPELIMGDVTPVLQDVSFENPLTNVGVVLTLYAAHSPRDIVRRVRHCKRPGEGSVEITEKDAEEILYRWKEKMENVWTKGWDDENDGEVQFVAFFDDSYVVGTTGRMLREITLDNNTLTTIAIVFIALFSAVFLVSLDLVESRVFVTLVGVSLVVLAFYAALGFAILIGNKISISIAWTLPFVILGLGVDDMVSPLLLIVIFDSRFPHDCHIVYCDDGSPKPRRLLSATFPHSYEGSYCSCYNGTTWHNCTFCGSVTISDFTILLRADFPCECCNVCYPGKSTQLCCLSIV